MDSILKEINQDKRAQAEEKGDALAVAAWRLPDAGCQSSNHLCGKRRKH